MWYLKFLQRWGGFAKTDNLSTGNSQHVCRSTTKQRQFSGRGQIICLGDVTPVVFYMGRKYSGCP